MKNVRRFLALTSIALAALHNAEAQNSTSSPYSMYGVGLITPKEDAAAAALGHSGIALAPSEWLNISNPAGIANLDSLTFYFNFQFRAFYAREKSGYETATIYSANIDGITMGFRGRKWLAMAIGYAPYSTVGYRMSEKKTIIGTDTQYRNEHSGSGGLSQAFINAAFTLFNHWTIGGNFSVLWGNIEHLEKACFSESIGGEDIYNKRNYALNNIYWELGTQFDFNIGQNNFRFGAVYSPKIWLHTSYDQTIYNSITELESDDSTPDRFHIPRSYGAGFTYQRKKLLGTIEYKVSEWGDVPNNKFKEKVYFRDTYTVSGGLQYSPGKPTDPFYKRIRYRAGGFYGKDYIDLEPVNLMQSGFSLGLTVPLGRSHNAITLSYEHQKRGIATNGMIKESFNNFKIALNIRETWFLKSKFD
ncbi:MAG: hypothetical protein II375_06075 [Bacteroidales bacterium]|nr:hypothetical protein [Bacteroidales bacterium]